MSFTGKCQGKLQVVAFDLHYHWSVDIEILKDRLNMHRYCII